MIKLLLFSALCQVIGFAAGTFISDPILSPLLHGLVSFIAARSLKLPGSWQFVNLMMPIALYVPLQSSIIPLTLLIILILIFLPTLWTKVPYYPTNNEVIEVLRNKLPGDSEFIFADFGSGFGGVLFDLASSYPKSTFIGYELGVVPYFFSKIRSFSFSNVKIHFQSFWKPDWKNFNYIYAFLSPQPMSEITAHYEKLGKERPVFFVNSFPLDIKEKERMQANSQVIYLYE